MSFSAARRATTQVASRSLSRRMSTAPRLHKAKDEWAQFVNKRPAPDVSSLLLIIGMPSPYSFCRANLLSECAPSLLSVRVTNFIPDLSVSS
jgi:hypothetical protein